VVDVVCINRGLSQARSEKQNPEARRAGMGFLGRGSEPAPTPPHQLGVWSSAVSSPSGVHVTAPEEVGFGVFWGFRNHQFLFTTHCSPALALLALGMTVFGQVGLRAGPSQSMCG